MRTPSYVVPFLFVLSGGCASQVRQAPTSLPPLPEPEAASVLTEAPTSPPTVAGDIQFTMTDRKSKASPASEDQAAATTLQPLNAATSGMTNTGVTTQHVHSSQ
jgi:hypothetical protein